AKGDPGVDGTDGITRIEYVDGDGTPHQVATLDDGLRFSGNDNGATANGYIGVHLNDELPIVGADANTDWSLFDGGENLMTKATKDGKLRIALAKNLTGLDSIQVGGSTGPIIGGDGKGNIKVSGS